MNSYRSKVTFLVAGVALLAVVLTAWGVASTTQDSLLDALDARSEGVTVITDHLTSLALEIDSWSQARDDVEALAEEFNARILLTDEVERVLIDTSPGGTQPEFTAIIDPSIPFGPFADLELADAVDEEFASCLEEAGVVAVFDEFGFLTADDADLETLDECYDQAVEFVTGEVGSATVEPALLFIEFGVAPPIPWPLLVLVAGLVLGLSVGAAAFASGIVTGPVRRLTEATRAVRRGDLNVRVEDAGTGEMGELASSFNQMAADIEREDERRRQLTSDVAHELRTPVTNIIAHVDAIQDGVVDANAENLGIVLNEAERLHRLIEDLGRLAQADEGHLSIDLEERDILDIVGTVVDARPGSGIVVRGESAMARVDPTRVEQIVGNLVDNAITAAGEGNVQVDVRSAESEVQVIVADDGHGIPEDLLPVIFDRFRRADQARTPGSGGSGLGLSIARALARAHGGDIVAANKPEGGAVFTVTLPAGRAEALRS